MKNSHLSWVLKVQEFCRKDVQWAHKQKNPIFTKYQKLSEKHLMNIDRILTEFKT